MRARDPTPHVCSQQSAWLTVARSSPEGRAAVGHLWCASAGPMAWVSLAASPWRVAVCPVAGRSSPASTSGLNLWSGKAATAPWRVYPWQVPRSVSPTARLLRRLAPSARIKRVPKAFSFWPSCGLPRPRMRARTANGFLGSRLVGQVGDRSLQQQAQVRVILWHPMLQEQPCKVKTVKA